MTLQESLQDGKEPLDAFPEQHYAALAKIIHESLVPRQIFSPDRLHS